MKTKTKWYLGGLVALVIIVGTALMLGQGELFKGSSMERFPSRVPQSPSNTPSTPRFPGNIFIKKPDLVVDSYKFTKSTINTSTVGKSMGNSNQITLNIKIRNASNTDIGLTTTNNSFQVTASDGAGWKLSQSISQLPRGGTKELTFTKSQTETAKNNSYRYTIMVDSAKVIAESNENNNVLETHTFPYIGVRDLQLKSIETDAAFALEWTYPERTSFNKLDFELKLYTHPLMVSTNGVKVPYGLPLAQLHPSTNYVKNFAIDSLHFDSLEMPYARTNTAGQYSVDLTDMQKKGFGTFISQSGTSILATRDNSVTNGDYFGGVLTGDPGANPDVIFAIISKDKVTGAKEISNFVWPISTSRSLKKGYMAASFWSNPINAWNNPAQKPDCVNWPFPENNWFGQVLSKVYELGFLHTTVECGPGPCANECNLYSIVNKAEATTFIYHILNSLTPQPQSTTQVFEDVPMDLWYAEAVNSLSRAGYLPEASNGNFYPNQQATLDWFASVKSRIPNTMIVLP